MKACKLKQSSSIRRVMTYFAVVWTTKTPDDKFLISYHHLQGAKLFSCQTTWNNRGMIIKKLNFQTTFSLSSKSSWIKFPYHTTPPRFRHSLIKLESMDDKLTQLRTCTFQLSTHDMSLHVLAPGVTLV